MFGNVKEDEASEHFIMKCKRLLFYFAFELFIPTGWSFKKGNVANGKRRHLSISTTVA